MFILLILVELPFTYNFFRIFQLPVLGDNCLDCHDTILQGIEIGSPSIYSSLYHFHSNKIYETGAPNHLQISLNVVFKWALYISQRREKRGEKYHISAINVKLAIF